MCGDVMIGRGIDQILPHPCNPTLHEPSAKSALVYVDLAEQLNGPIPRSVDYAYIWGDAEPILGGADLRIANLETAITTSDDFIPKGINYRMNPRNIAALTVAHVDCCTLANNHVLDWGPSGLEETLTTLATTGIAYAGAGRSLSEATRPALLEAPEGHRVLVFAFGFLSSGIGPDWKATDDHAGVNLITDTSTRTITAIAKNVQRMARPGDVVAASIHWGGNWGYDIPQQQRAFAHDLIDHAGFDVIQGHSAHHAKAIEVHNGRLILYGCGDFIDDYEGISGYEDFRGDLALAYIAQLDLSGLLVALTMTPFQRRRFRLDRIGPKDLDWLHATLGRECEKFGTRVELIGSELSLRW
jgi:poly-gamma-glutamate synthesis protein (capsule biosynthesis protein)